MPEEPSISIVVTTWNEGAALLACLRSLAAQERAGDFEIVVVDDRSTDGTADAVVALAIPGLRLIRIETYGHPVLTARQVALDTGLRAARGEIICLTDADAIAPRDWACGMWARLKTTGADLAGGPVEVLPQADGSNRWVAALQTVDSAFYTGVCAVLNALGVASGVVFNNCAFRRGAYLETGGFEQIGFGLTEDLRFARAVKNGGGTLAFVARPATAVRACGSWRDLIGRAQRIGSGGFSALSLLLGIWMLLWLAGAAGSLARPGAFLLPFLTRHLLGAGLTAWWLGRGGHGRYVPLALVYEPVAIALGIAVMWCGRKQRKVAWGGVDYPR